MSDKSDLRVERDEESWDCRPGLEKSRHIAIPDGRRSGSSGSARSTRASSVTSEENVASEPRGFGGGGGGGGGGRSSCSSTSSSSSSISAAPVKRITTTSASLSSSSTTTTTTTVGGGGGGGDSGSGRGSHLRYSYEFLKKLQKSKLSRKAPECLAKLRQENILREMWRNENDRRDGGGDREVQLDLGMTRRSFVAGCQIANIQPSDGVSKVTSKLLGSLQSNAGGKDTTTQLTSGGGGGGLHSSKEMSSSTSNGPNPGPVANSRRIGSGRLERTFKDTRGDRDRDYGYGMSDREHQQQQQQQQQQRTMNRRGAFDFRRDSRGDMMKPRRFQMAQREDEPEWFTEGPTSQTDTIELGGFDDARSEPPPTTGNTAPKRSIMTQAAREERERRLDAENARNRRSPSPRMAGHQRRSQWSEKELLEELTSENRKSAGSPLSTRDDDDVDDDNEVDGGSDVEVDHHHRNRGRRHEDADVDVCGGSGDEDNNNNQNHHPHHHHSKQITPDGDFSSQERGAPINFDHLFLNDERDSPKIDSDEAVIGSRFMSKVFAKASSLPPCSESPVMMTTMTTSQPPSEPPRPILHMLQQQSAVPHDNGLPPPPPAGPPAILRELMHLPPQQPVGGDLGGDMGHPSPLMTMMNNSHPNNGVSGMMPMGPGPQNPLEALLGAQMPPHGPLHHHHPHPLHHGPPMHHHHGMPPMPGAPLDHMNNSGANNNKGDHISGKNLIELLLLSASAPGTASPPPPPPQHAKSVEQLEADLKLQFSRPSLPSPGQQQQQQQQQQHQQQQQQQPSHPHPQSPFGHGPPHGGLHAAPPPVSSGGLGELGMQPHAPMDRPLNGLMPLTDMDGHCAVGPMGPMGPHFQHGLAPMGLPHHSPQQQQQQHSPGHSAGQNIMRMLAESVNRVDMGLGRSGGGGGGGEAPLHTKQPAFKQDLKNVPTQVLLREKDLLIQREHNNGVGVGVHGAPRPIVKSNKGSPPSGPQPPPPHMLTGQPTTDTGAEFLQKLLQSSQQHHQQQQQHSMSSPLPPTQLGDLFGGNGNMNCNGVPTGVTNSSKMIRSDGSDPPPMPRLQRQPPLHQQQQQQQQHHYQHQGSLALDQLFAASAATQVGQQQHHHHQQQHTPPPQALPSQPQQQQQRQQHQQQQQQPIRMNNMGAPSAPRPLTGMHGQRYGDLPYHSGPHQPHMPMQQLPQQQQQQLPQQAHQQEQNQEQSSLKTQANSTNGEMGLSKWLGNWASGGGSAAMTPSMPRNVLRVEDLERQQQMHHHGNIHHAKMPAAS